MTSQSSRFEVFQALHQRDKAFVIPNPWDAGSARLLASLGFEALATTSAGYAFSVGKLDSQGCLSRDEILSNAAQIVNATDLPVSADLEDGFGAAPDECAKTIELAVAAGLVGGSIEDATGNASVPIYGLSQAVERIYAAAEASQGLPFLLTARAENFLWEQPDLDDTIKRLQAYSAAGAHVLYAPGLPDLEAIRLVCESVNKPVNVVMGLGGPRYSIEELSAVGVRRISVGGSFARAALGALMCAANEVLASGTFEYSEQALSGREIAKIMTRHQNK